MAKGSVAEVTALPALWCERASEGLARVLGDLLQRQGDLAGARQYYERALAVFEKVLGGDHPDTAATMNSPGEILISQGTSERARSYLKHALAIFEARLGPDHPDTKLVRKNLRSLGDG